MLQVGVLEKMTKLWQEDEFEPFINCDWGAADTFYSEVVQLKSRLFTDLL